MPTITTPAKVEIRNVKHAAFASKETECFEAAVYIDGVKAGTVSNEGTGGCDRHEPYGLRERLNEIAAELPPVDLGEGNMITCDAELLVGRLLTEWLNQKSRARLCAKQTLFRKPEQKYGEGEWSVVKAKFTPQIREQLLAKYPGAEILNESL